MVRFNEYSVGERHFILIDGRVQDAPRLHDWKYLHALCLMYDASGVALMEDCQLPSPEGGRAADFSALFYGRDGKVAEAPSDLLACAVAFADVLGIKAFHSQDYTVENSGTVHRARILSHLGETKNVSIDGQPDVEVLNLGDLVE